jgi:uncharacterized protein involved in tellurium resistance
MIGDDKDEACIRTVLLFFFIKEGKCEEQKKQNHVVTKKGPRHKDGCTTAAGKPPVVGFTPLHTL